MGTADTVSVAIDLFKKLMDKGDDELQVTIAGNLERLLKHAHDERQTLQALIASAATHKKDIPQVNASLDESGRRAAALAHQVEDLSARVNDLESVRRQLQALERRVGTVENGVQKAEDRVQQTLAREAQVEDHREAVQQLVSLGRTTVLQIDALKRESAALAQLEERLPRLRLEIQPLVDQQLALKSDIELLRAGITTVAHDAEVSRDASLKARAHATKATDVVAELQRKLEPLSQIQTLSRDTETELRTLNALAEHVSAKVKALQGQQSVVEHALVESRRVHEMVWEMEVQINKLAEGSKRAGRVEETVAKLERLQVELQSQFEDAMRARETFGRDVARQEREATELSELFQRHLDQLSLNAHAVETIQERLRVVESGIGVADERIAALMTREAELSKVDDRVAHVAAELQELTERADTLQRKQAALGALEERLDSLETMAKRTDWQLDCLAGHRKDLEALKAEIQTVHTTYEQTATLLDRLRADKHEVERFLDKSGGFVGQAAQLETKIDALAAQIAEAEASASRATVMADAIDDVAAKIAVITPRLPIVDELEGRLNGLNVLSAEVERRLSDQLARRAELERMGVLTDGVTSRLEDAQQKLAAIDTAQAQLEPTLAQISALQAELNGARATLQALQQDEDTLEAQERRMADLAERSRLLSREVAGRLETVQTLQVELSRASSLKEQLLGELAQIQNQEREASDRRHAAEDQVRRLDALWKKIEERRSQLEEAEHTMAAVDDRMNELRGLSDDLDRKIQVIGDREQVVEAVRRSVEAIHAVGQKSQSDLAAVADRRAEIAQAKSELDRLRGSLAGMQDTIVAIESRRQIIDDVQRKADLITHTLGDVQIRLDSVSEQKAMVDHVFAELAHLEFLVQEARGTMKALQAERDVAQRIVENVRQIHARTAGDERKPASLWASSPELTSGGD